jgi:hypothetical protein
MNMFNWLLIGHLIGDWLFQNNWMAHGKQRGPLTPAILVHCAVYSAAIVFFLWIASSNQTSPPFPIAALSIYLSHWLIDGFDLPARWMRLVQQSNLDFVRVMVDQTFHLLALAVLVEFLLHP